MNKRIRTIPLPYRNVGKCAEKIHHEILYIFRLLELTKMMRESTLVWLTMVEGLSLKPK